MVELEVLLEKAIDAVEQPTEMVYNTPIGEMKETKPIPSPAAIFAASCAEIVKKVAIELGLKTRYMESDRVPIIIVYQALKPNAVRVEIITRTHPHGDSFAASVRLITTIPGIDVIESVLGEHVLQHDLEALLTRSLKLIMAAPWEESSQGKGRTRLAIAKDLDVLLSSSGKGTQSPEIFPAEEPKITATATPPMTEEEMAHEIAKATGVHVEEKAQASDVVSTEKLLITDLSEVFRLIDNCVEEILAEKKREEEVSYDFSALETLVMNAIYETVETPEYYVKDGAGLAVMPLLKAEITIAFLRSLSKLIGFLDPSFFVWAGKGFEGLHRDVMLDGVIAVRFSFSGDDASCFHSFDPATRHQFINVPVPNFINQVAKKQELWKVQGKKKKRTDWDLETVDMKVGGSEPGKIFITTAKTATSTKRYATWINPVDKRDACKLAYRQAFLAFEMVGGFDEIANFMTDFTWLKSTAKAMKPKEDVRAGLKYSGGELEIKVGESLENTLGTREMEGAGEMPWYFNIDVKGLKTLVETIPFKDDAIVTFTFYSQLIEGKERRDMLMEVEDVEGANSSRFAALFGDKWIPREEEENPQEQEAESEGGKSGEEGGKLTLKELIARLPEAWTRAWEDQFGSIYGDDRTAWPQIPDLPDDWEDFVDQTLEIDENIENLMKMMKKGEF